jgi:hypothetical protein
LTINGAAVVGTSGHSFDGDGDGYGGGNYTFGDDQADKFYALFGDGNGDGLTDFRDFSQYFLPAFGSSTYREAMDYDGDGFVDFNDFRFGFLPNFGKHR